MVKENDIITDGTTKWKVRRLGGGSDGNPVGTIIMYAANNMPEGYLLCDGSAVSRTDYAELFKVIGTTWGAGDGSTTFNLPNAVNRFPEGSATAGGYIKAGLPANSHLHSFQVGTGYYNDNSGARSHIATGTSSDRANFTRYTSTAIEQGGIYGKSATVQPLAFTAKYLIRYIL